MKLILLIVPFSIYALIGICHYFHNRNQLYLIRSYRGKTDPYLVKTFQPDRKWLKILIFGCLMIFISIIFAYFVQGKRMGGDSFFIAVSMILIGVPVLFEAIRLRFYKVILYPDRIVFKSIKKQHEEEFCQVLSLNYSDGLLVVDCGRIPRLVIPLCFDNPQLIAELESRIRYVRTTTTSAKPSAS